MLTTSHYLLGGFLAGSCAIGALLHPPNPAHSSLSDTLFDTSINETIDVSNRGSGRIGEESEPDPTKSYSTVASDDAATSHAQPQSQLYNSTSEDEDLISHRGSGRIRPSSL